MTSLKDRFYQKFPGYFEGAYYEKEDTNLGDELLSFIETEFEAIALELRQRATDLSSSNLERAEGFDDAAAIIRNKMK